MIIIIIYINIDNYLSIINVMKDFIKSKNINNLNYYKILFVIIYI